MKKVISIIDAFGFVILGSGFALMIMFVLSVMWFFGNRYKKGSEVRQLSFAIFDLISNKYSSMFEDALLNGYVSKHYYIYLDYDHGADRFENIDDKIYFYSVAAHPDRGVYKAGFRRISSLLVEVKTLTLAIRISAAERVTFVKAHDPHLIGLNGLVIAKLFRLPCILHLNSDFDMKYRGTGRVASPVFVSRSLERIFERMVLSSYDMVMADREFYKNSKNYPKNRLGRYIATGVRVDSLHYSEPSARRNLRQYLGLKNEKIVLYVGRLHPVKYPDDAIKAFSIIKRSVSDSVFIVVGAGIMKNYLEDLAAAENIRESVRFLGPKKYEELVDILATADVLLAPHGGMTLVESALAATPIVTYDFDWHPEVVEEGKMGYMVPFRDVGALARKTERILLDDGLRKNMGEYCRGVAVSRYSRSKSLEKEKGIYDMLVKG